MSPINTTVPSSIRRPGAFHEFRFNAAGQQLASLDLRLVIVAEKTAAGTAAADTPVQIFDELDSETKLGAGSFADLGAKKALAQGKLNGGGSPEVWACPVAENAAGTATQHTLTVSGPATEAGTLLLRAAGRTVDVGVSNGDSADTIAAAIKTRLDELRRRCLSRPASRSRWSRPRTEPRASTGTMSRSRWSRSRRALAS
jgi:phage tail sheath gpL-like